MRIIDRIRSRRAALHTSRAIQRAIDASPSRDMAQEMHVMSVRRLV